MASKRHTPLLVRAALAILLVFPPLTSAIADGLGMELAHHHCASHDVHDTDHDQGPSPDLDVNHDETEFDPFQCDQCHVALAAIAAEMFNLIGADVLTPEAELARTLVPVRAPPIKKPPIV